MKKENISVTIPSDTTPHHSAWQCTDKDLGIAYFTVMNRIRPLQLIPCSLKPQNWFHLFWFVNSLPVHSWSKISPKKKFYITIKNLVGALDTFVNFDELRPDFSHFWVFGSVLPSGMVTVKDQMLKNKSYWNIFINTYCRWWLIVYQR